MAQIPLGDFDEVRVQAPVRTGAPSLAGAEAAGGAKVQLGQQMLGMAEAGMHEWERRRAAEQAQADALARVKATNAAANHQLRIRQAAADVATGLREGTVSWADAQEKFQTAISAIEPDDVPGMSPIIAEGYKGAIQQNRLEANLLIDSSVAAAKADDGRQQWGAMLDTQGKLAADPGYDIDRAVATVRAAVPQFRAFGLDPAVLDKQAQDFADTAWGARVAQRANTLADDVGGLRGLLHDLTAEDGAYAGKLDAGKRNALAAQVGNRIDTLEAKAEHAADRMEALQERTLAQIDAQNATAIPADAATWAKWAEVFPPGSPRRAEFDQRVREEREIQGLLRLPIAEQLAAVQVRQQALQTQGGDVHAVANFNRLQAAVQANVKLLREEPLAFAAARLDLPSEPLDLQSLADPSQAGKLAGQLHQRATTIAALRKQFGNQVQERLLTEPERTLLVGILDKMPPEQKLGLLGGLAQQAGDPHTYGAILQQIAPDSPVTARAGELAAAQRKYSPDLGTVSPNVGLTLLKGEALLNKTKGDKATDGKAAPYPMPSEDKLRAAWASAVGSAYANDPASAEARYQEMRAYYAGRTAESGRTSDQLDERLAREAVVAVAGRMVEFQGKTTPAPWGMSADAFTDKAQAAIGQVTAGLPAAARDNVRASAQLAQVANGLYVLTVGRMPVTGADGKPLVVRIR